jgi:hypothetical protein
VVPAGGHAHWPADIPHIYTTDDGVEVHASLTIRHRGCVTAMTFPPSAGLERQEAS